MKGIEKIIAHIEADADSKVKEILEAADAKVAAIKADSAEQSQKKYWEMVHSGAKESEAYVARTKSNAEMEAKKSVLAIKQEMVSAAFEKAKAYIANLPEAEYTAFLARLACSAADNGMEEVLFNEKDKNGCAKAVCKAANEMLNAQGKPGKLTVSEDTADIMGGLIVRQGGIEVNCSIEALVEQQRGNLSAEIAAGLFE